MAAKSPVKEPPGPSAINLTNPTPPPLVKPDVLHSDADVVNVPSYSRWFSFDSINECEVKFLPEFFESRSPSKNPRVYKYYRDSIIKHYRENPLRKITFTDVRRTLVGDVGTIRRVFDFLETWGLINYFAPVKTLKWEEKESKSSSASVESSTQKDTSKRVCNGCKTLCTIACFACDKYDLTLCARCYVRGNHRVGVSSSDFRRVEISEETKVDWTEKETLQLLEAIMHYGDDWRKVAQHVTGRSEKDCITHFITLPFGEQFFGDDDNKFNYVKNHSYAESKLEVGAASPSKRIRLTPLADASNPIMAQAAFLSALAGVDIAEVAAQAAMTTLSDVGLGSLARNAKHQEAEVASNGNAILERASADVNSLIGKEELAIEKAMSGILEVQVKEIRDKIVRFENLDLQMEKEWKELEQVKNVLFVDQLSLLFQKTNARKAGDQSQTEEDIKTDVS